MQFKNNLPLFDDYAIDQARHMQVMHGMSHKLCLCEIHNVGKDLLFNLNVNSWLLEHTTNREPMTILCELEKFEEKVRKRKGDDIIPISFLQDMKAELWKGIERLREKGNSFRSE